MITISNKAKKQLTLAFVFLFFLILCVISARYCLKSLGSSSPEHLGVLCLTVFFSFCIPSRKIFFSLLIPIGIIISIYAPIGLTYGSPNYQALISLYSTNFEESLEFITLFPLEIIIKSFIFPFCLTLAFLLSQKLHIKPWKNKSYIILTSVLILIYSKPTSFFNDLFNEATITRENIANFEKYVKETSWSQSSYKGEETDYILIIGESARRDYFHTYGYPISNTPFLDKAPAIIVDGLTSGDIFTVGSLGLMLTDGDKNKWTPRFDRNIIDLAKSAGIETVWISNQGLEGVHDTPISAIGYRSDRTLFLNKKDYESSNLSDMMLITALKQELPKAKKGRARLIVLHTMGSHPDACKRLTDFPNTFEVSNDRYQYISCYVSSISKTDLFIKKTYEIMINYSLNNKRKFSILYFSDHGQGHEDFGDKITLKSNPKTFRSYDIPLILFGSDIQERKYIKSQKSGLNFTAGLAKWLNIKSPEIENYSLFDSKDDLTDYNINEHGNVKDKFKDDPYIDITPFLKK